MRASLTVAMGAGRRGAADPATRRRAASMRPARRARSFADASGGSPAS